MSTRIAVFASGSGSNLQKLLEHFVDVRAALGRVELVVTDRPGIGALERAERAGVPSQVLPVAQREEGSIVEELTGILNAFSIDVVVLAGYLRRVPRAVVARYRGRILNIHPALLPGFGGKGMYGARVHQAVLQAGCRITGPTVHLVDEEYDTGPILAQWPVPVLPNDTTETLAARVLRVEHLLLPLTVEALLRRGDAGGAAGAADGPRRVESFIPGGEQALTAGLMRQALGLASDRGGGEE